MIPTLYEEVENLACKRQRLEGEYHFMNINQSNEIKDMVPQPPTIEIGRYYEIPADSPSCSRVSGSSEECMLQSQIVSAEVMTMYMEGER